MQISLRLKYAFGPQRISFQTEQFNPTKRKTKTDRTRKKKYFVKITIFRQFLFGNSGDKKIVKATKNNCYFDRYGCNL